MIDSKLLHKVIMKCVTRSKNPERVLAGLVVMARMGQDIKETPRASELRMVGVDGHVQIITYTVDGFSSASISVITEQIITHTVDGRIKGRPIQDFDVSWLQSGDVPSVSKCLSSSYYALCAEQVKLGMNKETVESEKNRARILLTMGS